MSLNIELGWPAKALSPNFRSRSHWPRTNAIKDAREWAYLAALEIVPKCFKHNGARMPFLITAYPPDKRERDDDNLIASLKAARDGIAQALGIDDKLFDQRLQWGEPVKHGRVVVSLGG